MTGEWLDREALITVKAYPNPSAKYHESVCVAAITKEEGWIRLYPVQFRSLPPAQRFKKYQRVRLRMRKHESDRRPESYRPDEHSIELGDVIGTRERWFERRQWIKPTLSNSMCAILERQAIDKMSLGVFRPKEVSDFVIMDDSPEWSGRKQSTIDQLMLFEERKEQLEKIPFVFKYKYVCDDDRCKGHEQSIIDWELMELYRNVRNHVSEPSDIKARIRAKYLDELCGPRKDTHFFVGNHSRFPKSFMVLGVFWPPDGGRQLTIF